MRLTNPDFTAQTPERIADALVEDPSGVWVLEHLHRSFTGSLPRPLDAYNPLVLTAMLSHMQDAIRAAETRREEAEERARKKRGYDTARTTGDPEIDRWEREIAAGRTPKDW